MIHVIEFNCFWSKYFNFGYKKKSNNFRHWQEVLQIDLQIDKPWNLSWEHTICLYSLYSQYSLHFILSWISNGTLKIPFTMIKCKQIECFCLLDEMKCWISSHPEQVLVKNLFGYMRFRDTINCRTQSKRTVR